LNNAEGSRRGGGQAHGGLVVEEGGLVEGCLIVEEINRAMQKLPCLVLEKRRDNVLPGWITSWSRLSMHEKLICQTFLSFVGFYKQGLLG
jgi:hypothetical protein